MTAFAAVDLGASSGRVMVGRLSGGGLDLDGGAAGSRTSRSGSAGRCTGTSSRCTARSSTGLRAAGPVASVGVDSWAVDYGLLDGSGALLGNPVHYRDARTDGVPGAGRRARSARERLYATTGLQQQPFNTLFQLAAAAGTPQLAAAQRTLLLSPT